MQINVSKFDYTVLDIRCFRYVFGVRILNLKRSLDVYLEDHPRTDGYVVNNHGDHKSPKDRATWDPF